MDKIDLPEFQITSLEAKVDTGAFGSALHCHHIEVLEESGKELLRFQLLDPSHPEFEDNYYYAHSFGLKEVKNSFGTREERFTIITPLVIFGQIFTVEFSLTDRKDMRFPVLLGRTFLRKRFLVDVSKKNLSFKKSSLNKK